MVKGVQFLVDESGEKTAVLIDLRKHAKLWEDFYDRALAASRQREPREARIFVARRIAPADARGRTSVPGPCQSSWQTHYMRAD